MPYQVIRSSYKCGRRGFHWGQPLAVGLKSRGEIDATPRPIEASRSNAALVLSLSRHCIIVNGAEIDGAADSQHGGHGLAGEIRIRIKRYSEAIGRSPEQRGKGFETESNQIDLGNHRLDKGFGMACCQARVAFVHQNCCGKNPSMCGSRPITALLLDSVMKGCLLQSSARGFRAGLPVGRNVLLRPGKLVITFLCDGLLNSSLPPRGYYLDQTVVLTDVWAG